MEKWLELPDLPSEDEEPIPQKQQKLEQTQSLHPNQNQINRNNFPQNAVHNQGYSQMQGNSGQPMYPNNAMNSVRPNQPSMNPAMANHMPGSNMGQQGMGQNMNGPFRPPTQPPFMQTPNPYNPMPQSNTRLILGSHLTNKNRNQNYTPNPNQHPSMGSNFPPMRGQSGYSQPPGYPPQGMPMNGNNAMYMRNQTQNVYNPRNWSNQMMVNRNQNYYGQMNQMRPMGPMSQRQNPMISNGPMQYGRPMNMNQMNPGNPQMQGNGMMQQGGIHPQMMQQRQHPMQQQQHLNQQQQQQQMGYNQNQHMMNSQMNQNHAMGQNNQGMYNTF